MWICGCGWKERSNPNSWWHKMPRYYEYVDVDERREATLIHDDTRCQDIGQLFAWIFAGAKSPMFFVCVFGCVLFVCKFMVCEVYNSMKTSLWVGFGDGVGLLLHLGWLLNEECGSHSGRLVGAGNWMEARESWMDYKQRSSSLQREAKFLFSISIRKQKFVC